MDPSTALQQMLQIAARIIRQADHNDMQRVDALALAELVNALHEWLKLGNSLPTQWPRAMEDTKLYHKEHGHPVAADHPMAVSKYEVVEAIRPKAVGQLPAIRPCNCANVGEWTVIHCGRRNDCRFPDCTCK